MNTREHQFDEQWRHKLHDFGEDPDEGLIEQIQVKKDRMINLYKLTPYLVVGMLVTVIGISCFLLADALTGNKHHENAAPKVEQNAVSAPASEAGKTSFMGKTHINSESSLANTVNFSATVAANVNSANTSSIANNSQNKNTAISHQAIATTNVAATSNPDKTNDPQQTGKPENTVSRCTADFDYYTSYNGELNFINTSDAADKLRMEWTFGDGTRAESGAPAHKYGRNGTYAVSLNFFAGDQLVCSKQKDISYRFYAENTKNKGITGLVFEDSYLSEGAIVILYKLNPQTGRYEFSGTTKTASSGQFTFGNMDNGRYMVSASKGDQNYLLTYYGDVTSLENASAINLAENDNTNAELTINLQHNYGMFDRVSNNTNPNKSDTGTLMLLLDKHRNVVATVRTDRNGKINLEHSAVPPGTYTTLDPQTGNESTVDIGLGKGGNNGGTNTSQAGQKPLEQVKLIPNPAISDIHFDLNLDTPQDILIRIINSSGVEVFADTRSGNVGLNTLNVLIDEFPPGVYYVLVKKGNADPVVSQLIKK